MAQQGEVTVLNEAKDLLVQGKRFMALEDFPSATDYLEKSCQLFDSYYGVGKRECADAYLEYGHALVALANLEAGSGADKIMKKAGIEEEEEEDEEDDDDDEGEDEEEGKGEDEGEGEGEGEGEDEKQEGEEVSANGDAKMEQSDTNGLSDTANTNGESKANNQKEEVRTNGVAETTSIQQPQASTSEPTPGTSTGNEKDEQDEEEAENEEPTSIEIAWEVLCLAKRLYMTDESLEGRLKLAETLQKLGEISIEWDNNDNAVSILEECLKIRLAILKPDDRLIALTYYNLGLAHSFKSDTQNANENFQNAVNVIEKRITSLTEDLEKAKANQDTVAIGAYQHEVNELKELLPEMTMRIDDSKEDSDKSADVLKRTREEMQHEDEEAMKVCSDSSKPVDDITHLIKRKAA